MTPDQEAKLGALKVKQRLAAERLQRIATAFGDAAFYRLIGELPPEDESEKIAAYEQTLKRIDAFADREERILQEAGILPSRKAGE